MYPWSNSKVTMELRELLKSTDENGNPFKLWDFEYPSFYEGEDKIAFEQKVIDHYLFRQIGAETPGRFKHNFKTRIREIMPYYLQLYKSVEVMNAIDDPFGNVDIVETFEQETTDTSTGEHIDTSNGSHSDQSNVTQSEETTGNATSSDTSVITNNETLTKTKNNERRLSSTPMGEIENLDLYLTEGERNNETNTENATSTVNNSNENESETSTSKSATVINQSTGTTTASTTGETSASSTGTVKHTFTKKGNQGVNTYAHDMIELRQTFINVDMMIINELNDLFLRVY